MTVEARWVMRVPHKTRVYRRDGTWGYTCKDCYAAMYPIWSWKAAFAFAFRHSSVASRATTAFDWA